jgi:hypothetical protein
LGWLIMDIIVPLLVCGIFAALGISGLTRRLPERNAVSRLVVIALIIRVSFALLFFLAPSTRIFHDDASGYEDFGLLISRGWHGDGPPMLLEKPINYGYYYWSGAVYYLFGGYRLHLSLFNSVIGCLSAILLYRIGVRLFVERVARRALLFALFFPSMILWSSIAVKDTIMVFLLVAIMHSMVALWNRFTILHGIIVATSLAAILTIRFYIFYIALAAIVCSVIFSGRRIARALPTQLVVIGVLALLVVGLGLSREASDDLAMLNFERLSTVRSGLASTADSGWRGTADVGSAGGAIAFMPVGILFLLFSPFPWQLTSLRPILTIPELILWWGLTFAWLRGILYALRSRRSSLSPMVWFAFILIVAYSPMHGNVGVAFRQRSQILIFLFLFAAIGQELKRVRKKRLPDSAIEVADFVSPEAKIAVGVKVPPPSRALMGRRPNVSN